MRTLLHMPFDPGSRMIRLVLAEKSLQARLAETPPWAGEGELAKRNPALTVPVLLDEPPTGGEIAIAPALAIAEYLEEAYSAPPLAPKTSAARAEMRRLCFWFDEKFEREVNERILRKRIDARMQGRYSHDTEEAGRGLAALAWHLDYLNFLLEQRPFVAGERLTVADLAAAAHLSASDYLGVVPWANFSEVRDWYRRMKSRPSMRPILADRLSWLAPPACYPDPDF